MARRLRGAARKAWVVMVVMVVAAPDPLVADTRPTPLPPPPVPPLGERAGASRCFKPDPRSGRPLCPCCGGEAARSPRRARRGAPRKRHAAAGHGDSETGSGDAARDRTAPRLHCGRTACNFSREQRNWAGERAGQCRGRFHLSPVAWVLMPK